MADECVILILEDNRDRQCAMRAAVESALPGCVCVIFRTTSAIIQWWQTRSLAGAAPPVLISLDHDLEFEPSTDSAASDPGDGRDVARLLAGVRPSCPVLIHSTNSAGAASMICTLEEAGWEVARVIPHGEVEWIQNAWVDTACRLVRRVGG